MTSTSQDLFSVKASARAFTTLLLVTGLLACGASTEPTEVDTGSGMVPSLESPLGVIVDLDSSQLPQNLPSTATLYVYLRNPGERMPLAVEQYALSDIPASVVFNADQAMPRVEVVARISPLGKISKSAADLETTAMTSIGHPQQQLTLVLGSADSRSPTPPTNPIASSIPLKPPEPKKLLVSVDYIGSDNLSPSSTVFIVAHAPGVAMPLAVKKLTLADLPVEVTLTDADSMLPSNNLSSAKEIEISAHVSVSGRIQKTPGNWVGKATTPTSAQGYRYEVHIDQKIE